jgi:hypothetical protein
MIMPRRLAVQHSLSAFFSTRPIKDANTRSHYFIHPQIQFMVLQASFDWDYRKFPVNSKAKCLKNSVKV